MYNHPNGSAYSTTSRPESYYYEQQQPIYNSMDSNRQSYQSYPKPPYYNPPNDLAFEDSRREFRPEPPRREYPDNRRPQTSMERPRYFEPRYGNVYEADQIQQPHRPPSMRSFHNGNGYQLPPEPSTYDRRIQEPLFQSTPTFPSSRASSRNTNLAYQRSVVESEHGDPHYSRINRGTSVHRLQQPAQFVPMNSRFSNAKPFNEKYSRFEGESEIGTKSPSVQGYSRQRDDEYVANRNSQLRQARSISNLKPTTSSTIREEADDNVQPLSPATYRTEEPPRVKALPDIRASSRQMEDLLSATSGLKIDKPVNIDTIDKLAAVTNELASFIMGSVDQMPENEVNFLRDKIETQKRLIGILQSNLNLHELPQSRFFSENLHQK